MEQVNLNRQVFDKEKFNETIDTSFSQLGPQQPDPSFFDTNLATVEDFFTLYNKFFFEIPKEGQTNSHTYLITESTEYVGFQQNQEEIQALLQEIADLREENLELRKEIVDLTIKTTTSDVDTENKLQKELMDKVNDFNIFTSEIIPSSQAPLFFPSQPTKTTTGNSSTSRTSTNPNSPTTTSGGNKSGGVINGKVVDSEETK